MSTIKPKPHPKPHEIWLFLDSQTFGGIETHVIELAKGLTNHNCNTRVILLTQYEPESSIVARLAKENLPYSYLADLSQTKSNAVAQLRSAANQHMPQLIHAHGYKASIISKCAKLINKRSPALKQLSTYHAGETPSGRVWLYDFIDRYTSWVSDRSLVVSDKIRQKLPTRSILLNNFVNVPSASVLSRSDTTHPVSHFRFGFVGRLSHEKAADRFVELATYFPQHQFDLFGDGPERSKVAETSPENCHFHGHQNDMALVWPQIDVLIIPSRFEGLPMAALEAMVRGIPVIATAVGNLPELISHRENSYLAQSTSDLRDCVDEWLNLSHSQQVSISNSAKRSIIDHYSPQAVIPKLLTYYAL
ncbi:glycosyltransferase family 4 protein [Vibrio gigantis]|uniref:glycosyltransferase family 4 protein n=1 Tax=Vibrio gigantis TaxID=296199 RepID=UPI001EFB04DF|nr:glycosyltransferase family 4 protein [Vibrio gigantis]ULN62872.1 glycosyltransferase family 4 protein [Vibrio gigantis]